MILCSYCILFGLFFSFQLTKAALKDYNRGRTYLMDLAKRQEIPVFDDLKKATKYAIDKVKQCKGHHSN